MNIISDRRWQRMWHHASPVHPCDIPRSPGVYAIYLDRRLIYIGQSQNLLERINGHRIEFQRYSNGVVTPWGAGWDVRCKYTLSVRYGDWLMREARLIKRLQPPGNKRGNLNWRSAA